jgi:sec1 family domain-containing protein 1
MASHTEHSTSSLKSAQLNAIYRMLDFNGDYDGSATNNGRNSNSSTLSSKVDQNHHQWKILIYDTACRSIISPILSVQQLRRKCNVTLHLLLNSDREAIQDVPAIYFVLPTRENLVRIAQDCYQQLYASVHLNFVTKLERPLMEEFAKLLLQSNVTSSTTSASSGSSLSQIASIHDQYLNYICYEDQLFTLNIPNSYIQYNNNKSSEQMIDAYMTNISYGLFSIVASLGQIPIIRCPKVCHTFFNSLFVTSSPNHHVSVFIHVQPTVLGRGN